MKRYLSIFMAAALAASTLAACGSNDTTPTDGQTPGQTTSAETTPAETTSAGNTEAESPANSGELQIVTTIFPEYDWVMNILGENPAGARAEAGSEETEVDVDLTKLSSTMVYSEVFNMVIAPDDYIGKIVKMEGTFNYYHDETTDLSYYSCIIQDATACCSQGLEFVLAGDHTYPDDYPELGSEICVVGEFDTYLENESTYCTLRNARLV